MPKRTSYTAIEQQQSQKKIPRRSCDDDDDDDGHDVVQVRPFAMSLPPELLPHILAFWSAKDLEIFLVKRFGGWSSSCQDGLHQMLIVTLLARKKYVVPTLEACLGQKEENNNDDAEDEEGFLTTFETTFKVIEDLSGKDDAQSKRALAAGAKKCCALLGHAEVLSLKHGLTKIVNSGGLSLECKTRELALLKKDLLTRGKWFVSRLDSLKEDKLAAFVQEVFQGLEAPDAAFWVTSVATKCCVVLEFLDIVMKNPSQADENRILWPVGLGKLQMDVWVGNRIIRIPNVVLVSSPLEWNPSIVSKFHEWLDRGIPGNNQFVTEPPSNSWLRYMGMVTLVDSSGHMVNADGSLGESGFEFIDRTCGDDGLCATLELGDDMLMLITRAFATSPIFKHSSLEESERYAWMLEEKVDGRNFFVSWGWDDTEFRDEGPYEVDTIIRVMENIATHCHRRPFGKPFHK